MGRADYRRRPQRPHGGSVPRPRRPVGGCPRTPARHRRRGGDGGAGSGIQVFPVQLPAEPSPAGGDRGTGVGEARTEAPEEESVVVYAVFGRTLPYTGA